MAGFVTRDEQPTPRSAGMTRMASRTSKALVLAGGKLVGSLGMLVVAAVLSRVLSRADYATYRQALLVFGVASSLILLGLPDSLYYFLPKAGSRSRSIVVEHVLLCLGLGVVLGGAFVAGAGSLASHWFSNPGLKPLVPVLGVYALVALPVAGFLPCLVARDRAALAAGLNVALQLGICVVVIGVATIKPSPEKILAAQVAVAAAFLPVALAAMLRTSTGPVQPSWRSVKRQLAYAIPAGVAAAVAVVSMALDKLLVSAMAPPTAFAVYVNGAVELPIVAIMTSSAMAVVFPDMARMFQEGDRLEALALWRRVAAKSALVMFPLACLLFVVAPDALTLLYSEAYRESAVVFRVYLLLLPLRVIFFGTALMAAGRPRHVMYVSIVSLAAKAILSVGFLLWLGPVGAAVGSVVASYTIGLTLMLVLISRAYELPVSRVLPLARLGKAMVIALAACAGAVPAMILQLDPVARLLVGGCGFAAVLLALYAKAGYLAVFSPGNLVHPWSAKVFPDDQA